MAKCMQCGGSTKMKKMQKGGSAEIVGMPKYGNNPRTSTGAMLKKGGPVKKMQDGGKTTYRDAGYKTGIIKSRPTIGKGTLEKEVSYGHGYAGPSGAAITKRRYDNEGVLKKEKTRKIASEKVDKYVAKNESKIEYKKGGVAKAKFGATVDVQRGYPGKIRSAEAQGYTAVGKREPARTKFAKGGSAKSFPDLNKDGKITKADILKGRGVIKRKGGAIKKK